MYTKQDFYDGQVLKAEHLIRMEEGILSSQGAASWEQLQNRPFYDDTAVVTDFPVQEVAGFALREDMGVYMAGINPAPFPLTAGTTYTVTWETEVYTATAQDSGDGTVALGDGTALGLSGNGEPFLIGWSEQGVSVVAFGEGESHSFGISHTEGSVKTLDAKYLPMDAIDQRIGAALEEIENGTY